VAAAVGARRLIVSSLILFGLLIALLLLIERNAERGEYAPNVFTALNRLEPANETIETGVIDGAAYRIDLPKEWNGGLVVFYHGYAVGPMQFAPHGLLPPALRQFVDRGYAVAQSAFSAIGWAIEEGSADSEKLRRYFVDKHGNPKESFVIGMSMGGILVVHALETFGPAYDGGLSMCGAIERSDYLIERDFLLLSAFDFHFPGLLGPLYPAAQDFEPSPQAEQKIAAALASSPDATQALLRWWGVGNQRTLAGMLAFDYFEIAELQRRAGGNPFDTEDFIFTGSGNDLALNAGVRRYAADAAAASYLQRWYTPSGRLTRPLLALHDSGDPLVPAFTAFDYALAARHAGHAENFVQQFVNRDGHCAFTAPEVGRAFDELIAWVHDGKRPVPGVLPN